MIHITFVSNNFRSSSVAMTLYQQAVPTSIIDMLLESSVASILGDDGDPEWAGARGCCGPGTLLSLAQRPVTLYHPTVASG